jgi:hypothetical protein
MANSATQSKPLKTKKIHLIQGHKFNAKVTEVYGLPEMYNMMWCETIDGDYQDTYLHYHITGNLSGRDEAGFKEWLDALAREQTSDLVDYCNDDEDLNFWILNDFVKRGILPAGTYAIDASELI